MHGRTRFFARDEFQHDVEMIRAANVRQSAGTHRAPGVGFPHGPRSNLRRDSARRFHVRLAMTVGSVIERDVEPLLVGPVFDAVRDNPDVFRGARVDGSTVVWPNGADMCSGVLIWGGPPREGSVPDTLVLAAHAS